MFQADVAEELGIEEVDEILMCSVIIVKNMAILLQNAEKLELKKIRLIVHKRGE